MNWKWVGGKGWLAPKVVRCLSGRLICGAVWSLKTEDLVVVGWLAWFCWSTDVRVIVYRILRTGTLLRSSKGQYGNTGNYSKEMTARSKTPHPV